MAGIKSFMPAKRLIASYIFDWIVIIAIAAIGAAFNAPGPYKRPFSLLDLSISFPYMPSQISTTTLVLVSLVAPGVIIFLVCLLLVPGPTVSPKTPKSLIWRRKFWEWNTGWMGLGLSLAIAFFLTQGMKNLFGKPRPDMLARCQPDLSDASIRAHTVGNGYGATFDPRWVLVSSAICQQTDSALLNDGFRSFPSGHASMSWSGLLYLAFFFCSKFAITIPYLAPRPFSRETPSTLSQTSDSPVLPLHTNDSLSSTSTAIPARNQAAAPPTYLLILPLIPVCAAIYITSTRYFQFYHHGFDIIIGSTIGILSSWFAFRWYHLPVRQGAGWSWGARSRDRAWAVPVGVDTYVGAEGWASKKSDGRGATNGNESTSGNPILGPGLDGTQDGVLKDEGSAIENAH